jgi:DNA-binding transcriptional ArsR family regulator
MDIAAAPGATACPSTTSLSEIGAIVADPGRANMLSALLDGRARTALELAECAGVTPQTASSHIARLVGAGFLMMQKQGRHRYHRLASPEVAHMIEALHLAATALAPRGRTFRPGPHDDSMRLARSCYDHLAGRTGVALSDALSREGLVTFHGEQAAVTDAGWTFLEAWGLRLAEPAASARAFCRPCIDWSERRPHLAGTVAAAIFDHLLSLGWIRRTPGTRALSITPSGQAGFYETFGISGLKA